MYCTPICQQAAGYKRKRVATAVEIERVFRKRKEDGLRVIDAFDRHRSWANILYSENDAAGIGFMGTRIGVLKVVASGHEDVAPAGLEFGYREVKTTPDDPQLKALLSIPSPLGRPYRSYEAERDCRALLANGATDVSLYLPWTNGEWERYFEEHPPVSLPTLPWDGPQWPRSDALEVEQDAVGPKSDSILDNWGAAVSDDVGGDPDGFDPREEPDLVDLDLPEDAGVMDYADPFWR